MSLAPAMPVLVASVASVALVASALTPQLVEVTTTAELATYLRAGDSRLVRPSPSATTAARQKEAAVLALLPAVLQELIDERKRQRRARQQVPRRRW